MQYRRHSRRAIVRLIALVAAGLAQARSVLPATAVDAVDYCPSDEERAFITHLNAFRQANGLGPLRLSRTLGAASRHHSADMAARAYFSHQTPEGEGPGDRALAHGYPIDTVGENIAAGMPTGEGVFQAWEDSSGHRSNMLTTVDQAVGIGRAEGGPYLTYWTMAIGRPFDAGPQCEEVTPPPPTTTTTRPPTTTTPRPTTTTRGPTTTTPAPPPPPDPSPKPDPGPVAIVDPVPPGQEHKHKSKRKRKHERKRQRRHHRRRH